MTPAEAVIAEVGGFLFLGAALAVTREALRKNWIKLSLSASITKPADRFLPAPAEPAPGKPETVTPIADGRRVS